MPESLLLTDAERTRFAAWLKQNAESADLIAGHLLAGQMNKLECGATLAKQLRFEVMACKFIANKLLSTESFTTERPAEGTTSGER